MDARRTRAENRPNRAIHRVHEALEDFNKSLIEEHKQPPVATTDLVKNMRKLAITAGEGGAIVAYWDARLHEIKWATSFQRAIEALGRDTDLCQMASWASIE